MSLPKPAAEYGSGARRFSVATGSPGELGLVEALGRAFARVGDATLVWVKAGTGQSLSLLQDARVDMAMVHAPALVDQALAAGWATGKTLIGCNEFYIVGPADDPAQLGQASDAIDAYRRLASAGAESRAKFVSRGDHSGTHQKEMALWQLAGVEPAGDWYIAARDFMTASLMRANLEGAYFMCDSSTWIMEQRVAPSLQVLFRDDPQLVNIYHAIVAPPGLTTGREAALQFVNFVASPLGQKIIREHGRHDYPEALYNDAIYARRFD